jgi:alginate O-acetyltransferase complex protein AlgI
MLFHSLQFLLFLPLIFALYWSVPDARQTTRHVLLLVASLIFYMAWNPAPVVLILYLSTCDWLLARLMAKTEGDIKRKLLVTLSVTNNLAVLGVFKYAGWITKSVVDAAAVFGVELVYKPLGLILPVGLSFVVFQCLSYTIDVYRRELEPRKSWLDVVLFISFFPQIVAGPIVRAADFLPQLDVRPRLSEEEGARALFRIATGMFKKLVIADLLSANLVDRVFAEPANYTGLEVIAAVFAYTAQIYYDFSAYSDIAIGSAALFGYKLRENFDKPYLSTNLFEFWRRWHMSLGRWLFDYLYRPLGGNRVSKPRVLWNLWVTMILGSVWHGADWRFVIWGAIHGAVLVANRLLWWTFGKPEPETRPFLVNLVSGLLTFFVVMEARIVFRAPDMAQSWAVFVEQWKPGWTAPNLTPMVLVVMAAATLGHLMTHGMYDRLSMAFIRMPIPVRAVALLALALGIKEVSSFEVQPFIYFQF